MTGWQILGVALVVAFFAGILAAIAAADGVRMALETAAAMFVVMLFVVTAALLIGEVIP